MVKVVKQGKHLKNILLIIKIKSILPGKALCLFSLILLLLSSCVEKNYKGIKNQEFETYVGSRDLLWGHKLKFEKANFAFKSRTIFFDETQNQTIVGRSGKYLVEHENLFLFTEKRRCCKMWIDSLEKYKGVEEKPRSLMRGGLINFEDCEYVDYDVDYLIEFGIGTDYIDTLKIDRSDKQIRLITQNGKEYSKMKKHNR
ncbi:MAG: hypothetical protein AAFZ15_19770 [Bacteroidota bacterium]